jgi:hypothetical protein
MRINNNMKDSYAKFEEWWEVAKEYFVKKLEKNLAQHKIDGRTLRYKLEVHQKKILDFVYGNPTNTKALSWDEETEIGLSGTTREKGV